MAEVALAISLTELLQQAPRITDVRIHELTLRKSDPTWRFALAASAATPGFVLALSGDGVTGYGSASEIRHLGHDLSQIRAQLDQASPALRAGRTLPDLTGPARAIVHTALLDLVARRQVRPAYTLLGPLRRPQITATRILSLKSPNAMAAIAVAHQGEGYRHVKIKLDNADPDIDVARVRAIREAVGPDFGLTVDANQSYSPEQAVRLCEQLVPLGVAVFEQPVPAEDLAGLAFVTARSAITIEADEAAATLDRVREIADRRAAHGVSIKIPKLGGADLALVAAAACADAGLNVRIGAHVGSRVLNAVAVHLAAVLPNLSEPAEVAEFARLEGDPATGLAVEHGVVRVPVGPGLGITVTV